jgi:ribonuclease HII
MARLSSVYPEHGWDHNAGYSTAGHRDAPEHFDTRLRS